GPGYEPAEQQIDVATAPLSLSLRPQLVPVAEPEPPRPERVVPPEVIRATTRGLYISGGAVAALGLGLIGGGVAWTPAQKLSYLRSRNIGDCTRCKLARTRTNIVFGVGDPNARLMFIGE